LAGKQAFQPVLPTLHPLATRLLRNSAMQGTAFGKLPEY
jgi:hypothetical protein